MLPAIKVWEMDYSFIIENYLDVKLWDKTWTLFAYKDYVITIKMYSIRTESKEINFFIGLKDNSNGDTNSNYCCEIISYRLDTKIDFLLKKINGTIFRLIEEYERKVIIPNLPSYSMVDIYKEQERIKLEQIANDYLDENSVNNETIREVYVENYVDNNSEAYDYAEIFKHANKYHHLPDFYLVFLKSVNDDVRYQMVLNHLEDDARDNVMKEISELQTYIETDTYEEDMKSELESI